MSASDQTPFPLEGGRAGDEGAARDLGHLARTEWLNCQGYRVIRFNEADVRRDVAAVIARILAETVSPSSQTLPPSRGRGLPAPPFDRVGEERRDYAFA